MPVPALPPQFKWQKNSSTQKVWDWLWAQPLAGSWDVSESQTVARYCELMTQTGEVAIGGHATEMRPYRLMPTMLKEIRALEDCLGLSLAAREKLGIEFEVPSSDDGENEVAAKRAEREQRMTG